MNVVARGTSIAAAPPTSNTSTARTRADEWWWRWQRRLAPYIFISPFIVLFCCFMLYPLCRSVVLSFYKAAGPRDLKWVGLGNYRFVLTDRIFWAAVFNTTYYAVLFLPAQITISLALAVLLNSKRLKLRNIFRFSIFSPHLVGSVFVAVIFQLMLAQRHGLVNKGIGAVLPWVGTEINWFGKPELAMPAVVIAALWISIGYAMVYFLAALQAVDRDLYEAADVDGAGKWQQFWHITVPGIRPVLIFLVLVGTIGAFQLFELPYVLFYGVWTNYAVTIVVYLFQMGFESGDLGYASAIGWMLVVIIVLISLIQLRLTWSREDAA